MSAFPISPVLLAGNLVLPAFNLIFPPLIPHVKGNHGRKTNPQRYRSPFPPPPPSPQPAPFPLSREGQRGRIIPPDISAFMAGNPVRFNCLFLMLICDYSLLLTLTRKSWRSYTIFEGGNRLWAQNLRDGVQSSMSKKNVNRWCLGEGGSRPEEQKQGKMFTPNGQYCTIVLRQDCTVVIH